MKNSLTPASFRHLTLLALALLAACNVDRAGQSSQAGSSGLAPLVQGVWLQSTEENRADTLAYRHNTYLFPRRPGGRSGFRIGPDGQFTRFDLALAGGLLPHDGTWTDVGNNRIRIHLPNIQPAEPDYELHLISYDHGKLRVIREAGR